MKAIYNITRYVFLFLICFTINIFSQGTAHPFSETTTLLESGECVLVWHAHLPDNYIV